MKTRWFVSMSAALPAALLASDASPAFAAAGPALPAEASAELELRAVDSTRLKLYAGDAPAALAGLVDDAFRYTGANGDWLNKRAFLELQSKSPLAELARATDVQVRAYGEVGVVVGAFSHAIAGGTRITTRYTDVYHRAGGTWRLVNEQQSLSPNRPRSRWIAPPVHTTLPGAATSRAARTIGCWRN